MAEGVLVVLVGRAAKAAEYLVSDSKRYRATLKLGITTDTEDTTGEVLTSTEVIPAADDVIAAAESFLGAYDQVPPMYSALKIGGKKLCDLARQGVSVEREARRVTIHGIKCEPTEARDAFLLDVACSSGTYIRTLCADIGARLGCGGAMATLLRVETGGFSLDESFTIAELEEMSEAERYARLIPTESLFAALPEVKLPEFYEKLSRSGCEIYQKKIGTHHDVGARVRLSGKDGFFALGEVREYDGGSAIKAIKQFDV
jgi:tRNA pseudouridine55 synthase